MATHSSILAWKIPWTEEPGGLWSMGSQTVGQDWGPNTHTHIHTHTHTYTGIALENLSGGKTKEQRHCMDSREAIKIWHKWKTRQKRSSIPCFIFNIFLTALGLSCGMQDLVLWPGMEPGSPALLEQILSHWTTREVSGILCLDK